MPATLLETVADDTHVNDMHRVLNIKLNLLTHHWKVTMAVIADHGSGFEKVSVSFLLVQQ